MSRSPRAEALARLIQVREARVADLRRDYHRLLDLHAQAEREAQVAQSASESFLEELRGRQSAGHMLDPLMLTQSQAHLQRMQEQVDDTAEQLRAVEAQRTSAEAALREAQVDCRALQKVAERWTHAEAKEMQRKAYLVADDMELSRRGERMTDHAE